MKEEWLFHGAVVPIDVETTAALVAEINRLIDVIGGMALAQPKQEPVGKLQEPTAERSWFTIAELNAWADKKLAENSNWVMPKDEPAFWLRFAERHSIGQKITPLYTIPPQRTWVGLMDEEIDQGLLRTKYAMQTAGAWRDGVEWAIKQFKEKNT